MSQRIKKINELLKHEISNLLLKELDFSKDVILTITSVESLPNLRWAKVRVSVLPLVYADKILKILNFKSFSIQRLLNQKLKMRSIPKIKFEIDKSEVKSKRIDELLREIK